MSEPRYTMSVARIDADGTRYIQFWDIGQVQAAVIRGCWGDPSEEIIESPGHHARVQADDDGIIRRGRDPSPPCLLCGSPLNRDGSCSADCAGVGDG